jgi:esterase/lipase superfamily enzyme
MEEADPEFRVTVAAPPASKVLRMAAACALALAAAGCVSSGLNDLTGAVASYSPLASAPGQPRTLSLLVASTHGERDGGARYSSLAVTVPPAHAAGVIERPVVTSESPLRHFTLGERRDLNAPELQAALSRQLAGRQGVGRDVLVYVHGYNTGAAEAAFRVAQIAADAGFAGAPVLFAWPSRNSMFSYGADREGATASRDALEKLLSDLGSNPDVGRVHVLAHSMGAWLAMESLRQAAIGGDATLGGKLGSVMLAAPDLDLAVFRGQVARIGRADNISLFVASDDRALALSARFAGARARVGALDLSNSEHREMVAALGVRIYDLTGLREASDFFRHGSYAEAPQIVQVIGARLKDARIVEAGGDRLRPAVAPVTSADLPAPVGATP